jgi:putative heme-binding domain-containing protein
LAIVAQLLEQARSGPPLSPQTFAELEQCLAKLWPKCDPEQAAGLALEQLQPLLQPQPRLNNGQLLLLSCIAQSGRSSASAQAGQQQALKELLDRVTERIVEELPSDKLSEAEQLTFINLLGSGLTSEDNELRIAAAFLHEDNSLQVRRTTIESLRRLRSPQVAEALLGRWPQLNAALRSSAGATLLSRREWALALVSALEGGQIPTAELDLATIGQLSTYGDRELRNRCLELLGQSSERGGVVADYLTRIPAPQPTPTGEKLFVEHCSACHRAANGQPQLGPPLENLGHWTLDQWVTAVLDPNQTVEPKYRQTTLLTTQGQVVAGLVLERGPQELLVGLGDGSTRRVAVADIEDEKDAGPSLMPVGFEQKLTPEQLAELIGYLRRAR